MLDFRTITEKKTFPDNALDSTVPSGTAAIPGERLPRILVSDDQEGILAALSLLLKINRFQTVAVSTPRDALQRATTEPFDLLLLDLNYSRDTTSGHEGLELLTQLREQGVQTPVVVMTAWGNVELAVHAMRLGANDFVQKPWDNNRLLATITAQLQQAESRRQMGQRQRSELEIARQVQEKLLPHVSKDLSALECAASCVPAQNVGGDYYDLFKLDGGRIAGVLADVSGKGVAAAMLMANLQACFRNQLDAGRTDARTLLQTVNRLFYATTPPAHYATVFYFEFDEATRHLQYVNCGHLPPALFRASGDVERLGPNATVVGLFPHSACECDSVFLQPGDLLALFTDGVSEFVLPDDGEEFGEERFLQLLQAARPSSATVALQTVVQRLAELRGSAEQADDQTILLLQVC